MKNKKENQYSGIFDELKASIVKTEDDKFKEISLKYLSEHKSRYLSDLKQIYKYTKEEKMLEVGSYPYHMTFLLKKLGYDVTGIDLNIERLNKFISSNHLKIKQADVQQDKLPFKDNTFDLIIFNEVFEHLTNPIHALIECNRVLKKNGTFILTTPNLYFLPQIVSYLFGRGAMTNPFRQFSKLYWLGHMGHIREYSSKEVKEFLTKTNFKVIRTIYRYYTPPKTKKALLLPVLYIFYIIYRIIPFFRPFQVQISKKGSKDKEIEGLKGK